MDDHHDEENESLHSHENEIFSEFHLWLKVSSLILLAVIITTGAFANPFIIRCVVKKQIGTSYVNPVLVAIACKNLLTLLTCIPLAALMLAFPDRFIYYNTCVVQETITFTSMFSGFFLPAVLSIVQCDHTVRPHNYLVGRHGIIVVIAVVAAVSMFLGVHQTIFFHDDDHGCHMWSEITDEVVLSYVYTLFTVLLVSLATMILCYYVIYRHASKQQVERTRKRDENPGQVVSIRIANEPGSEPTQKNIVKIKQKMATAILKPMFCIVAGTFLCALPWLVIYIQFIESEYREDTVKSEIRILAMIVMYGMVSSDPIIFLSFSSKGRHALRALYRRHEASVVPSVVARSSRNGTRNQW